MNKREQVFEGIKLLDSSINLLNVSIEPSVLQQDIEQYKKGVVETIGITKKRIERAKELFIKQSCLSPYEKHTILLRIKYVGKVFNYREIAETLGVKRENVNVIIKNLIDMKVIETTTPNQKRNRLYKLVEE